MDRIPPDVLAYIVCPFLGGRARASMLQLCKSIRGALMSRHVARTITYNVYDPCCSSLNYIHAIGAPKIKCRFNPVLQADLTHLCNLRAIDLVISHFLQIVNVTSYLPPLLESLHLYSGINPMHINFDYLPRLQQFTCSSDSNVTIVASKPVEHLASFSCQPTWLYIDRTTARLILASPRLISFGVDLDDDHEEISGNPYADIFNDLDALQLQTFTFTSKYSSMQFTLNAPSLKTLYYSGGVIPNTTFTDLHVINCSEEDICKFVEILSILTMEMESCDIDNYDTFPPNLQHLQITSSSINIYNLPSTLETLTVKNTCLFVDDIANVNIHGRISDTLKITLVRARLQSV